MPINLSIRNVPDDLAARLRERAALHRRSLQAELLAILEEAVRPVEPLKPTELLAEVRRLGVISPGDSVAIIRSDRGRD